MTMVSRGADQIQLMNTETMSKRETSLLIKLTTCPADISRSRDAFLASRRVCRGRCGMRSASDMEISEQSERNYSRQIQTDRQTL